MERKIILQFSIELAFRTDAEAERLNLTRSAFIRAAVDEKIKRHERQRIDKELEEGYKANAGRHQRMAVEFQPLATEILNLSQP